MIPPPSPLFYLWGHFRRSRAVSKSFSAVECGDRVIVDPEATQVRREPSERSTELEFSQSRRPSGRRTGLCRAPNVQRFYREEQQGGQPGCSSLKPKQEDITRPPPNSLRAALSVLECGKSGVQRAGCRLLEIGQCLFAVDCYADDSLS